MKKTALSLMFLLIASFASAQITTLTTVQDSGSVKAIYMTLAVVDENGEAGQIIVDNRVNGQGPMGNLSISAPEFSGFAHGAYVIPGSPDGTRNDYDSVATYSGSGVNPDGSTFAATGNFPFHAHFVYVCQGRGCPTYGWHYKFKAGSTVEVQ